MVLLLAVAIPVSALPQAPTDKSDTDDSTSGERHGSRGGRRGLNHVDVNEAGQPCLPNPLWERKVDPANYAFGCREIEVQLVFYSSSSSDTRMNLERNRL